MIELVAAVVGGSAGTLALLRFWPRRHMPARAAEALPLVRVAHEHEGHVTGTEIIGGKKHKRISCSMCGKRWVEPC